MKRTRLKKIILCLALLGLAPAAFSQYIWLNEKGVKQFSDMPPPASVPKNRILKEPGQILRSAPANSAESAPADNGADASAAPKGPMTTAEKNADFQKRRAEQAEKEKKDADTAKMATDKAKNCETARNYQRTLASGQRLTRTESNGGRAFLNDAQRAQEMQDTNRILVDCK